MLMASDTMPDSTSRLVRPFSVFSSKDRPFSLIDSENLSRLAANPVRASNRSIGIPSATSKADFQALSLSVELAVLSARVS